MISARLISDQGFRTHRLVQIGLLTAVLGVLPTALRTEVIVHAADYGLSTSGDAMPALRAAVEAVHRLHARKLVLPKGRFEIYPDGAFEKYCAVANHDNGSKRIAFPFQDLENLTVEGQGTELIFHGRMVPFFLERVKGFTLRGVSIDWAVPFNFQGTVISIDEADNSFVLQVLPELRVKIKRGQLVHYYDTGDPTTSWEQNLQVSGWFKGLEGPLVPASTSSTNAPLSIELGAVGDRRQDTVKLLTTDTTLSVDFGRYAAGKPAAQVEDLGAGRYRLRHAVYQLPEVGWVLVAKGDLQPRRTSPAISAIDCRDVLVQEVTVHHAGGMGFVAERCTNVRLDRFNVCRAPDSKRALSTTADATHFFHCRGDIVITHCRFENMYDDGTNVHGNYLAVVQRRDDRTVVARIGHYQEYGSIFADPGDEISFAPIHTLLPFHHQKLEAVERLNELECVLRFAEPLPGAVNTDTVLDNLSWQPNVRIDHTTIRNNRARSILIKTRGKVVIEDCQLIDPSSMAILASAAAKTFWESGPTEHIEIRRNTIRTTNPDTPVFAFHPLSTDLEASDGYFNRNIIIEDNRIETASGRVVNAWLSENLLVARNHLTVTQPNAAAAAQAFQLRKVNDVRIVDNQVMAAHPLSVSADQASSRVVVEGNEGISLAQGNQPSPR